MQLVEDGPEIPVRILDEQQRGNLVIFCGAGVSAPEGLPIFSKLVKRVKNSLGIDKYPDHIKKESEKGNYDRVLTYLDKEYSRRQVIKSVKNHLKTPTVPKTDIHRNLITLAKSRDEYLRLVTTNFDHLFEKASSKIRYHEAPALPVPKPYKWDSLVYLHGRINKSDDDGNHLVINTGDFGLAYLFEGWASNFITELFRHFTVLFVGYSARDPIMRYIVDALAIEREKGIMLKQAYAFGSYQSKRDKQKIKEEWKSKNIKPILYDERDDHKYLLQTLEEWSNLWEGGWEAKQDIVATIGTYQPEKLHKRQISQFLFAIKDPTGKASEKLAELGHDIPVSWMDYIEESKYWTTNETNSNYNGTDGEQLFKKEFFDGKVNSDSREKIYRNIAEWLLSDLSNDDLILWAVNKNLQIGEFLRNHLKRALIRQIENGTPEEEDLSKRIIDFWTIPLNIKSKSRHPDEFWVRSLLENNVWNKQLKNSLVNLLEVVPSLRKRINWFGDE